VPPVIGGGHHWTTRPHWLCSPALLDAPDSRVYIIFLPMAGVLSTLIPVFARRELVGYTMIVVAIVAMAFLSFGIWVHHMFTVGIPHLALAFFSAGSAIVAVPTAVQMFAWLATLAHGKPRWDLPMLYIFGFFFVFVLGGLTARKGRCPERQRLRAEPLPGNF
jgi:heme/copper-type cytochrome/quinol oxidase subunit 1